MSLGAAPASGTQRFAAILALLLGLIWTPSPALEAEGLQLAEQELTRELAELDKRIEEDRARLLRASTELQASQITPAILEDARLDLVSLQSRQSGLKTRLRARRAAIEQLEQTARSIRASAEEGSTAELATLESQRQQLESLVEKLEALNRSTRTRVAITRQRLNVLQARFELPDLADARKSLGPEGLALRDRIDSLLLDASRLRREAGDMVVDSPEERSRRRLLELKALAAEEQAEFLQMRMTRLQAERLLRSLSSFKGARSTPIRVLDKALENLARLRSDLVEQQALIGSKSVQFSDQRNILQQQSALSGAGREAASESRGILSELIDESERQAQDVQALLDRVDALGQAYQADLSANTSAELLSRRDLPSDAEAWRQLGSNLATLPIRVANAIRIAALNLLSGFIAADGGTQALLVLLLATIIGLGLFLKRRLGHRVAELQNEQTSADAPADGPLSILYRHFGSLIAPIVVALAGWLVELRGRDLLLLLTPLLIYPAVRIALDFVNTLLDHYTPELNRARTRVLLLETRWVVITAAVLAGILVCAHTVALSPAVIDGINRLSMLCLLLVALPLIHLRKLLLEGLSGDVGSRIVRLVSWLLPALLILCAVIGVVGYVPLAQAIAVRLGWLAIFVVGLHYIRLLLDGLFGLIARWFESRNAESAPYWRQYILAPLNRVSLVLIILLAAKWLFAIYQWDMQTPVVRVIPLMLDTTLFTLGETAIKLKTLGLALLVLAAAIWGAGWSRQVSYRWVFTNVVDKGLRNSLSTFTQYFVVVIGLIAAMKIIGLDLTALTVFAGALGVGIGFGMQQIVVNFISGILLLIERPLATTDLVNVDQFEGEVTRIGIRSLTVKTWDNQEVIIPNSSVITKPFTNWTRGDDVMRTVLMIGISYDDDPNEAIEILKGLAEEHPAILSTPAIKVLLWEYGDSALMIRMQFHSRIRGEVGRADLRSQMLLQIWNAFKERGITIPYPQRDLHIRSGAVPALAHAVQDGA